MEKAASLDARERTLTRARLCTPCRIREKRNVPRRLEFLRTCRDEGAGHHAIPCGAPRWVLASYLPYTSSHSLEEDTMSDRTVAGAVAAFAALLTLAQLLWMFDLFPPAAALAGGNGALFAGAIAMWLFATLGPLAAAAIVLLMTADRTGS
jgi:hypothetical protein